MTTDIKEMMQSIRRRAVDAKKYAALSIYLDVDHVVALIEALEAKGAECKHLSDELRGATALVTLMKIDARELVREAEAKDARIAELETRLARPVLLPRTNGYWTETEKAYEDAITLAKRQVRLAGFRCEGDA